MKKAYGQNFLIDSSVPRRIVSESGIDETFGVLEVGPGVGALTLPLARAAGKTVSVELDGRLLPLLSEVLSDAPNVEVIQGDILKIDLADVVGACFAGLRPAVVANLPYYITTPVLTTLLESRLFSQVTVMVQKEVADRMTARPGTGDYGAFSLFIDLYAEPALLFAVPPGCFYPPPKVDSAVVLLRAREELPYGLTDAGFYRRVVRAAFSKRRKTLANALFADFASALKKDEILEALRACGLPDDIRGERLSGEQFARLSRELCRRMPRAVS